MKSGYTNEQVVRGSALSYVIDLYNKNNGNKDSSLDQISINTDSKSSSSDKFLQKEYEHIKGKAVEDNSPFYKLETSNVFDWPDLDQIALPDEFCDDFGNSNDIESDDVQENTSRNDSCKIEVEINNIRTSIDDCWLSNNTDDNYIPSNQHYKPVHDIHNSKSENNLFSSNEQSVKPILLTPSPLLKHHRRKSAGSSAEQKSVTFSEDTVFNENKSKRYKKEKINLKDIYRGKIDCDTAIAKVNPVYIDDDEDSQDDLNKENNLKTGNLGNQLTDDEKVARCSVMIVNETKYLCTGNENEAPYPYSSTFNATQLPQEIKEQAGNVTPPFGRLIQRTLRKQRLKKVVRWLILIAALIIILAVAIGISVYFGMR